MTLFIVSIFALLSCSFGLTGCDKDDPTTNIQNNGNNNNNDTTSNRMKITIGSAVFTATLNNNATVTALKAMLPLTLNMSDLNRNEKYYHFSNNLPSNAQNIGTIQTGDLMLWGSNSFVLFYKTFNTSYNYTRIGRINNIEGLETALGTGNVTVKLELE